MVHALTLTVLGVCLVATAAADVDFTPKESFYLAEATRVPCVAFQNGQGEISYSPPGRWTLSGGGSKLTLTPPNAAQAGALMETRPRTELLAATEANIKAYREYAARLLPREASKVSVVEATVCPMQICRRPMIEVTLTYVAYAQQFTTNLLFLPHDKEEITFQITARTADFPSVSKAFRASLFSLQGF
jgi:hypothetical protein